MSRSRSQCIFCGQPAAKRAREHIVPKWLLDYLGVRRYEFWAVFNRSLGQGPISPGSAPAGFQSETIRRHTYSALVNGYVCEMCNHGWMSQLEEDVKPFLVPLMDNSRRIADLGPSERALLARWTAKTAYAWHFALGRLANVPRDHPRYLAAPGGPLPPRATVFAGQVEPVYKLDFYHSSDWKIFPKTPYSVEAIEAARRASYKLSFQLSHLHLMVAYWVSDGWLYGMVPGIHGLVFPPDAGVYWLIETEPPSEDLPSHITQIRDHHIFHFGLGIQEGW